MNSLQWRLSLIATAIAILAGCTIVGEGNPATPVFFKAHATGVCDVYAIDYGFLLLLALPPIVARLISQRFRAIAAIVGLSGLMAQPTLLKAGVMGCDLP